MRKKERLIYIVVLTNKIIESQILDTNVLKKNSNTHNLFEATLALFMKFITKMSHTQT